MELDFRMKSRRDRMMRSKSFDTQEVREIGRKEAEESRGFPMLWMGIIEDVFQMEGKECFVFVLFYLPFLSSIHEKANCIAILWTGSPHSLGSCFFRGLWATCLPHKGGGIPLSALPKDTTSELAGLFSTTSHKCRAPSREAIDTIFLKVFWYDSTRGMNPRSTDCEADALTTTEYQERLKM